MTTAGHTLADLKASAPARASTTEEWITDFGAGFLAAVRAEEHPDPGRAERVPDAHLVSDLLQDSSDGVVVGFCTTPSIRSAWS
jgi:hypothetical protein